ncbi:MAG: KTSC domain-containing protein [Bacteroidota bacterium]
MQLTTVDSSMIHAVGYDEDARELEVIFNSGGIYRYMDVDRDEYEALLQAESKGQYMRACIIDAYPYYKVRSRGRKR